MSKLVSSFEKKISVELNESEKKIVEIPVDKIKNDPEQVRKIFNEERLEELADSIKERGILNPVHVRQEGEGYIIITGERRFRASKIAKKITIPCIIHEYVTEEDIKALQLIENLQREDLSAIETAKGFRSLLGSGMKQRQIATALGISEGTVSRFLAIVNPKKIPDEWLENIETHCSHASLTDLYEIASANKKKKPQLYKKMMDRVQREVDIEEPQAQEEKTKKESKSDFSDVDLIKAWEILIKEKRKNIQNLALYISPKKIQALLDIAEVDE